MSARCDGQLFASPDGNGAPSRCVNTTKTANFFLALPILLLCACASPSTPESPAPYRASGTEPFWSLSIGGAELRLDRVGQPPLVQVVGPPSAMIDGRRYSGRGIQVDVATRRCEDAMSGAAFAETVTVTINDDETLNGCGGEALRAGSGS